MILTMPALLRASFYQNASAVVSPFMQAEVDGVIYDEVNAIRRGKYASKAT